MTVPSVELPSGDEMPAVGVGTREIEGDTVREAVRAALEAGCTHVDTAEGYNGSEIGDVLAEHDREELFLTSKDEVVGELADEYGRTPAQIVLRWALENDVVTVPKSSSPEHVRENFELFDWELEESDRHLDERDRDRPVYDTPARDWSGDVYGISE